MTLLRIDIDFFPYKWYFDMDDYQLYITILLDY